MVDYEAISEKIRPIVERSYRECLKGSSGGVEERARSALFLSEGLAVILAYSDIETVNFVLHILYSASKVSWHNALQSRFLAHRTAIVTVDSVADIARSVFLSRKYREKNEKLLVETIHPIDAGSIAE